MKKIIIMMFIISCLSFSYTRQDIEKMKDRMELAHNHFLLTDMTDDEMVKYVKVYKNLYNHMNMYEYLLETKYNDMSLKEQKDWDKKLGWWFQITDEFLLENNVIN